MNQFPFIMLTRVQGQEAGGRNANKDGASRVYVLQKSFDVLVAVVLVN